MNKAKSLGVKSVRIPTLDNKTFGFDQNESDKIMIQAVAHWLA
jgi:O-acetyl-ADP-ribose deacetylase (regulator of RNase III)